MFILIGFFIFTLILKCQIMFFLLYTINQHFSQIFVNLYMLKCVYFWHIQYPKVLLFIKKILSSYICITLVLELTYSYLFQDMLKLEHSSYGTFKKYSKVCPLFKYLAYCVRQDTWVIVINFILHGYLSKQQNCAIILMNYVFSRVNID